MPDEQEKRSISRFACETNPGRDQQQKPAKVIQPGKCLAGYDRNPLASEPAAKGTENSFSLEASTSKPGKFYHP